MLKLLWIPKEYKNISITEIVEEAERHLIQARERDKKSQKLYADLLVRTNSIANLSEKEARDNLKIIIPWLEKSFPDLTESGK